MSDSTYITPVPLERGQIIPAFTLPGTDNLPHSPWDYKQREHLLLLFLPGSHTTSARTLLRAFADLYKDFRAEQCALLAVTNDPVIHNISTQEVLHLPYPLLSDSQGRIISRYTHSEQANGFFHPLILLADRYNAFYNQWSAATEADLPPMSEFLDSLQYLNNLCSS